MPRPTFLVIGSQKAGTTTLHEVLARHHQVHMAGPKDRHFFTRDRHYRQVMPYYESWFEGEPPGVLARGEASVSYICHPAAPQRIAEHLPEVRLVLTVRNPVRRAYSQYWHGRRNLAERLTFEEALERYADEEYVPGRPGTFSRGFYMRYIERFLERFPREHLLVLLTDDLLQSPRPTYRALFGFLGVDESFDCPEMAQRANPARVHTNPLYRFFFRRPHACARLPGRVRRLVSSGPTRPFTPPPMRAETRRRLVDFYGDANRRLADFLGRDLDHWNE
jgi:hypothetical protein